MFTGLVEAHVAIVEVIDQPPGKRLRLKWPEVAAEVVLGESIAINGCCLTVVANAAGLLDFEAGPETLFRTNLGQLLRGSRVNVERSLRLGDRLGGHLVTGHVDGLGRLLRREDDRDWSTFWIEASPALMRQMVAKGSITVDGVSLTLVNVTDTAFSVALIPHTLVATTLGALAVGDAVNLETDLLAKYVQRQLQSVQQ